jgi:hypothetical protein
MKKKSCACFGFFYDDKIKELLEEQTKPYNRVCAALGAIIADERGISEKDFGKMDALEEELLEHKDRILDMASKMDGKRPSYCAEILYDEIFNNEECQACKVLDDKIDKDCIEYSDTSVTANSKFNLKKFSKK